jgi:hypothetical protein
MNIPVKMISATSVIERDQDTGLRVRYVPGFPSAYSQAESLDQLQSNLAEALWRTRRSELCRRRRLKWWSSRGSLTADDFNEPSIDLGLEVSTIEGGTARCAGVSPHPLSMLFIVCGFAFG